MKNHFVDGGEGRQGRHVGFPHGNLGSGEPDMSCATFVPGFLPDIPGFTMEVFLGSPLATCQVKLPGTGASAVFSFSCSCGGLGVRAREDPPWTRGRGFLLDNQSLPWGP